MPASQKHRECKLCGHPWGVHLRHKRGQCAKRIPVSWSGRGRAKRPIMGFCPCPGYIESDNPLQ